MSKQIAASHCHGECADGCTGEVVLDTVCCVGKIPDIYAVPECVGVS